MEAVNDVTIAVTAINSVSPYNDNTFDVDLDIADPTPIVEEIGMEGMIEYFDADEIIDKIGMDEVISHFGSQLVDRIKEENDLVEAE